MKSLNTMKFVASAISDLTKYDIEIDHAESYDKAAKIARAAIGYIECLNTFNSAMICSANNDFTEDFDRILDGWMYNICQSLINVASTTGQDNDLILDLVNERAEHQPM